MLFKNLDKWAKEKGIPVNSLAGKSRPGRNIDRKETRSILPLNEPPMMYRAQVQGRCNLQFGGENSDRQKWTREWILAQSQNSNFKPSHQYIYESLDSDHPNYLIHSIKIKFSYRVLSNSGQDSILRPVLTVHGIPFIPGSSVKGLFKRSIKDKPTDSPDREKVSIYCGTEKVPGTLRFHGAYPIGDWSNQMVDIVHPQQSRQVENNCSTSAFALISFYEPEFVFEFSSINEEINWEDVKRILHEALTLGLGGKTSTGYGFSSKDIPAYATKNSSLFNNAIHLRLEGTGVSSKLLSGNPEFRPNMFKAALRGHISRLLAGVCDDKSRIQQVTDDLFGSTISPGTAQIYWQHIEEVILDSRERRKNNPVYKAKGNLHILASETDRQFLESVLDFAYIMGGFGKTWRRVSHEIFYPSYLKQPNKFDIGCHWTSPLSDHITISNRTTLTTFLDQLYQSCQKYLEIKSPTFVHQWREAWHPENVSVYSQVFNESQAVKLFHQEPFKYTPAIGGRERRGEPKFISSVWHRMLPIGNKQYLEIVTIFNGNHGQWQNQRQNQRQAFITSLTSKGLELTWGSGLN